MRDDLTAEQRMQLAKATAAADRYSVGGKRDVPRDEAVAVLHDITRDPVVLGHVLAGFLHRVETESQGWTAAAELVRAAGANEDVAASELQRLRERLGR